MLVSNKLVDAMADYFSPDPQNSASVSAEQYNHLVSQFNTLINNYNELGQDVEKLQEANRQLTAALQKTLDNKSASDRKVAELTDASVTDPTATKARMAKIDRYKSNLLTAMSSGGKELTLNQKRVVNVKLLAFTELVFLAEGKNAYFDFLNQLNSQKLTHELEILSQAISQDNNLKISAITAYGYLSMMIAACDNLDALYADFHLALSTPEGAAEWLKQREEKLQDTAMFFKDSAEINKEKIPPLFIYPTMKDSEVRNARYLHCVSLSGAVKRESYDEFAHETKGKWPETPTADELAKGPTAPRYDYGLVFMGAEAAKRINNHTSSETLIEQLLSGEYDPILMNAPAGYPHIQSDGLDNKEHFLKHSHNIKSNFLKENLDKITIK